MRRHASPLSISLAFSLLVSTITFAQNANPTAPPPIDVLYIVTGNTIQTYNVDPSYGDSTLYGTLSVPVATPDYPQVLPGVDDHYVYVLSTSVSWRVRGVHIFVYATDSNGAPQDPPVQTVEFPGGLFDFMINPGGTLAYAVETIQNFSQQSEFGIRAFAINPKTGILTEFPNFSATTNPPNTSICSPYNPFADPYFSMEGFNSRGTQLIDSWTCSGHDDSSVYYYTQSVDQQTGALGPAVPSVSAGNSEDEFTSVTFTPTSILEFENEGFEGSANGLSVYWLNGTLDFSCNYTLLDACSYSSGIAADRSGKYIFFYTYTGATEVTRLNLAKKTIEPVGIPLTGGIVAFSLDDQLIYGSQTTSWNGQLVMPVYVFDPNTGLVSDNEQTIPLPNGFALIRASAIPGLWH